MTRGPGAVRPGAPVAGRPMSAGARAALALALGSFVLYNANVREISSQDTVPAPGPPATR